MAVTSYKSPGTCESVDRDGKTEWVSPDNAKASDNSYTVSSGTKNDYTDWLRANTFGFAVGDIPADATIDGIEVQIEHYGAPANLLFDSALHLRKSSGRVGSNKASASYWPTSDTYATYGGATDKWGTTWTDAEIKSIDFGLDFSAAGGDAIPDGMGVDHIQIRVYYTVSITQKSLAGTLNLSGVVGRKISVAKAGTLDLSGVLAGIRKWWVSLSGSLSFAGLVSVLRKIIGAGAVSVDSYLNVDTFHLSKFTAEFTGTVSKIKVYSAGNCNVKVAVYSDIGGEPSGLLSVVNTPTAVVAGWNTITIPNVSVNLGTAYWLAFNSG